MTTRTTFSGMVDIDEGRDLCVVACDLCGGHKYRIVMRKEGALVKRAFSIVRCSDCGFVFVNPRLRDDLIDRLYDVDYYHGHGFDRSVNYEKDTPMQAEFHRDVVYMLESALGGIEGKRCIDIGCGNGLLAARMREHGADAYGADSSEYATELAVRNGAVIMDEQSISEFSGTFDAVTAIEVVEHVTSPTSFLEFVYKLLKPGGILFISTGNWNLHRLIRGTPYVMPEGHLQYFTPATMRAYYRKVGIEESPILNVDWTGWRISRRLKSLAARNLIARALVGVTGIVAPAFSPLPVGRKPE